MDGKPLYEYARSNTPLPRPIPSRKVTISDISLLSFTRGQERTDLYEYPKERLGEQERLEIERMEKMVKEGKTTLPDPEEVIATKVEDEKKEDTQVESESEKPVAGEKLAFLFLDLTLHV
jgi:tRNA pseudouridine55 synthase